MACSRRSLLYSIDHRSDGRVHRSVHRRHSPVELQHDHDHATHHLLDHSRVDRFYPHVSRASVRSDGFSEEDPRRPVDRRTVRNMQNQQEHLLHNLLVDDLVLYSCVHSPAALLARL